MRTSLISPDLAIRLSAATAGAGLLIEAARDARMAEIHMALVGAICGTADGPAHCGWCYAAAAFGAAGFAALGLAMRPAAGKARVLRRINAAA